MEFGVAMTAGGGCGPQPYEVSDKQRNLRHIFNKDQVDLMVSHLGKSIYFTHVFTEMVKARKMQSNFNDLLSFNVSI